MLAKIIFFTVIFSSLLIEGFLGFQTFWGEKILPRISVGQFQLSGLTQAEAKKNLQNLSENLKTQTIKIQVGNQTTEILVAEIAQDFEIETVVQAAYSVGHSTNLFSNFLQTANLFKRPVNLEVNYTLNEARLDEYLENFASTIDTPLEDSKLEIKKGKVVFTKGTTGQKLDRQTIKNQIWQNLSYLISLPVTGKVLTIKPEIPEELGTKAELAAEKFVGKKIILATPSQNLEIEDFEILFLISPVITEQGLELAANSEKIKKFVESNLNTKVSQLPQDAKFQFDGSKVFAFQPSVDGVQLDIDKTINLIFEALSGQLEEPQKISLPVKITPAKVKTADVNNLGITELTGRGVSNFAGSATERVHNIKLAASRINGTLIATGEIFSFNQTIGEISTATGYTSAYIISKGRTILGEGGGVCQVSTTAFRAALNSGIEIIDRRAHAYRVRYYEQGGHKVGLDATIFVPTVDLKFKNDTKNYILIQAYTKGVELYFDFYGTWDGRIVEVLKPVVTNIKPAPEPQYEEDPTLPKGTTKQVDFAATGAYVEVRRTVKKEGQVLHSDLFKSNYKPWQAIFKVGTGTPQ